MMLTKEDESKFRPIPFYFINTRDEERLSQVEINRAMERVKAQHFGGIVLFNKPPEGFREEEYLETPWFEMTERFVLACRRYDLALWLNDGFNFPPGDAAGRIQKLAPHLKQKILVQRDTGEIEVDELEWGFPAFEEAESSALFIRLVYEEYRKKLGKYFGSGIVGFFSDADNRRVTPFCTEALGNRPYFPWCSDFSACFKRDYGYDLTPFLPRLLRGETGEFSHDYWQLAGRLYQRWFRNNYEWCHQNGLKYSFHTSDTGPFPQAECPRSSIYTEGNTLEFLAFSDCPGTDHELLRLDGGTHFDRRFYVPVSSYGAVPPAKNGEFADTHRDLRAKYAADAACLYGKERVLCEAFAATNWGVTYQELRRIAAWQIMQGVNFFIPHAVHHVLWGETKYFAPPEFSLSPLAHGVREFNDFLTHWSFLASEGEYLAPVAVIDPTDEIWRGTTDGKAIFALCDRLNRQGWGYRIVNRTDAEKFQWVFDPARGVFPELPPAPAEFSGNGDLHFMLRKVAGGKVKLLVANIWSETPVTGVLRFLGREMKLTVASGEIMEIREDGPNPPLPETGTAPDRVEVTLLDRHRIPLRDLREWHQDCALEGLELLVPAQWADNICYDGGKLKTAPRRVMLFDDAYCAFGLDGSAGRHVLSFDGAEPPPEYPVFLEGDMTAGVTGAPVAGKVFMLTYNLNILTASGTRLILGAPNPELSPGLLRDQGYPFYSGRIRYRLHYRKPGRKLHFPQAGNISEVWIGNEHLATVIFDGTDVELPAQWDGTIELIHYNTLGNQWEGAAYPNGLPVLPELC